MQISKFRILIVPVALVLVFSACGKKATTGGADDMSGSQAASEVTRGEELQISEAERKRVLAELGVSETPEADIDPEKRMSEAERAEARRRREERRVQRGDVQEQKPAVAAPAPPPPAPTAPGKQLTGDARTASRACKQCEFYLAEKDLNMALQKADAFIQQFPQVAEAYLAKAVVLRRMRKLEDAEIEVRRALGFDKDHEWAVNYLALLLRDQGRLRPAIWTLEDYRTRNPNSLPTLYSLGILYEIYAGFRAKALVTYVDYLKRGGTKQKDVNVWIDSLSIALGVERPDTPGWDKPVPPASPSAGEQVPSPPGGAPTAPVQSPAAAPGKS